MADGVGGDWLTGTGDFAFREQLTLGALGSLEPLF